MHVTGSRFGMIGIALVALLLAGCGVKGALELPPEAKAAAAQSKASADSGQGKPEGGGDKPHQGFILDGLLR